MKTSSILIKLALTGALLASSIAHAQVAVVMAPGAAPLTKEQVANLYLGRSAELQLLDLPEGNATRDIFYKKAADKAAPQVKATWSRIVFAGKGTAPKETADAAAVKKAVAADPKKVGYIDKAAVDGSVKSVLTLD